jgi:ABC-2 type transport system permease protein
VLAVLSKYFSVFTVGLQGNLVYRWNFAVRGTFSLIHLSFVFILWGAAFAGQTTIGGFDIRQTFTYFVCLLVLQFFISAMNEDYEVSEEIRNGLINQFLLKPVNYYLYRFSIFLSARFVAGFLGVIPIALAAPLFWTQLDLPPLGWNLAYAVPALAMSMLIQFTIAYCFGLLTFWFLEIQSFVILSLAVETVLGGSVFPLDLFPPWLYNVSVWLPYYYQMYFPAALLTGRITDQAFALRGLGIQFCWVVILLTVAHLLWTRGLRRHTAVGG